MNPVLAALEKAGAFLVEHADLVALIVDALDGGTPKDAIKAGIRAAKVKVSDEALKEELGLDEG